MFIILASYYYNFLGIVIFLNVKMLSYFILFLFFKCITCYFPFFLPLFWKVNLIINKDAMRKYFISRELYTLKDVHSFQVFRFHNGWKILIVSKFHLMSIGSRGSAELSKTVAYSLLQWGASSCSFQPSFFRKGDALSLWVTLFVTPWRLNAAFPLWKRSMS